MTMFWLRFATAIWCVVSLVYSRRISYPEENVFDDDFYSELINVLDADAERKANQMVAHPREVRGWGSTLKLGQVTGVAVDQEGRPVVFHRADRTWDRDTFNETHHFQGDKPIEEDVVMVLEPQTGSVLKSWGKGKFLLPHGITVDQKGNTWLTDVGLHQIFKFAADSDTPSLSIGEARVPGSDESHMCKPTSVAVASTGDFFIADGYCNARILRFKADGSFVAQFGHEGSDGSANSMFVPHGVTVEENRDALCIADRENRRVLCVKAGLMNEMEFGNAVMTLENFNHGRVFDVAALNGFLVGVAGSAEEGAANGFTFDLDSGKLLDAWEPVIGFQNPHSVAVSQDGTTIYVGEIGPNRIWKFLLESPSY